MNGGGLLLARGRQFAVLLLAGLVLSAAALWNGQPFFYPDTPTYLRGAEMGVTRLVGPGRFTPWAPAAAAPASALVRPDPSPPASAPARPSTDAAAGPADPVTQPGTAPRRAARPLTSIDDKVVLAGRSVYYGALLYAGYLAGGLWLTVAVQAICVVYMLHLLMVRLWGLSGRHVVVAATVLSAFTPLGVYTGFLMPDVLAPLVILSTGTLAVYWRELPRLHRWGVSALLLFGLMAHASHIALALLVWLALLAARAWGRRWRGLSWAALAVVAACLAGAVGAELAFNKVVQRVIGEPPLRLPHPMARLIDMGPGTDYLRQSCPASGHAACAYVQNYPTHWIAFLFSTDPATGTFALADIATKRRLASEQVPFFINVLRHDPWGVVSGIGVDVVRQITHFRVDIWGYGRELPGYAGRVPVAVFEGMQASRAGEPSPYNGWFTNTTYAAVLASLLYAVYAAWQRRRTPPDAALEPEQRRFHRFCGVVVAGVLANAIVCATLASSWDRFQSRVVWLIPFLAVAALLGAASRRTRCDGRPASPVHPVSPTPVPSIQGATP